MSESVLPKAPANHAQERRGISAVAAALANINQIWRETPTADVGIDGQLEFVDDNGFATGKTAASQVKTGPSYLEHEDAHSYHFYPESKHRVYWERYPLPVLLMLHDPKVGHTYWTDARQYLRNPSTSGNAYIPVPKANILQITSAAQLFETAGVTGDAFIPDLTQVMMEMINRRITSPRFPLSYFDLFAQGLTLIARAVYYGIDLATTAAELNMPLEGHAETGVEITSDEHNFLFDYVKFLVSQSLAHVDFADCLVEWVDREMHPHFVAPLSARGRQLVEFISQREDQMIKDGLLPKESGLRVCQEGFFEMVPMSYLRRVPRIFHFQKKSLLPAGTEAVATHQETSGKPAQGGR